jgi:YihY family inner membrane protein
MRVRVKARASRSLATVTPSRRELARAFVALALRADVPTLAASFAFSAVFAVGPLLSLALTALSTLRDDTFRRGVDTIARAIVPSVSAPFLDAIADQLKRASNPLLLAVSLLGLVWTLSSASDAIVSALEIIGRRDPRAWWRRRLRAVFLGLAVAFALAVAAVAVSLGPRFAAFLGRVSGLPLGALEPLASHWFRLPVVAASFTTLCMIYYRHGTIDAPPRGLSLIGAVFGGVLATLASAVLSFWFTLMPRLGGGYGAATAFFAVLLWLYVLGLSVCLGACLTHVVGYVPQHGRGA